MMDLAQHVVTLLEPCLQLLLPARDRGRHLADTSADRDHFRGPGMQRRERDAFPARNPAGKVLDVAQRPHAPAVRPQPDRRHDDEHCQEDERELAPVEEERRET